MPCARSFPTACTCLTTHRSTDIPPIRFPNGDSATYLKGVGILERALSRKRNLGTFSGTLFRVQTHFNVQLQEARQPLPHRLFVANPLDESEKFIAYHQAKHQRDFFCVRLFFRKLFRLDF